jgi:hypothetical protein
VAKPVLRDVTEGAIRAVSSADGLVVLAAHAIQLDNRILLGQEPGCRSTAPARPRPVARPHQPGRAEPALDLRPVLQAPFAVVDGPVIALDYQDAGSSSAGHDGSHQTAAIGAGTTVGTKPTSANPRKSPAKETTFPEHGSSSSLELPYNLGVAGSGTAHRSKGLQVRGFLLV